MWPLFVIINVLFCMWSPFLGKARTQLTVLQSQMAKAGPTFLSPTWQRLHAKANSAWSCDISFQRHAQGQEPFKVVIKALRHKEGVDLCKRNTQNLLLRKELWHCWVGSLLEGLKPRWVLGWEWCWRELSCLWGATAVTQSAQGLPTIAEEKVSLLPRITAQGKHDHPHPKWI